MTLLAINVLLKPDRTTVERAKALNTRLLAADPSGFALDAHHTPHITILQRFVPLADLEAVAHSLREVVTQNLPVNWDSLALGTDVLVHGDLGAMSIVLQPTEDWLRLQQRIIKVVAPYAVKQGTADAFAPRLDGGSISQPTVDYVNTFVDLRTGRNYNPHITVGIGRLDVLAALNAEPFVPFVVRAQSVNLYQLGDYGVAQRKLHDLHRC